ncbi:MAG: glyoxalase, partial [Ilumatobacteraceae bacterium]
MSAFQSLRSADRPVTPDRRFADDLRSRITAALVPPVDLPERSEHMHIPDTDADTETPSRPGALVPYLTVHDAVGAIDWYRTVFDATELVRYVEPDGKVGHCQLLIQGSMVMVSDEYPDFDALSPRTIGGSPIRLNLNVPDV